MSISVSRERAMRWLRQKQRSLADWRHTQLPWNDCAWRRIIDLLLAGLIWCGLSYARSLVGENASSDGNTYTQFPTYILDALVALAVPAMWRATQSYRRAFGVFARTVNRWQFIAPCLLLLTLGAASIALAQPGRWTGSIGVLFPIGISAITVAGFVFTITKLDDILSRLHSYDILLEHLGRMIDAEMERARVGAGQIVIVANAPAFGNISAHEKYPLILEKLARAFHAENMTVRIICKDWNWFVPDGMDTNDKNVAFEIKGVNEQPVDQIKSTWLGGFYWAWENTPRWDAQRLKKPYFQSIYLLNVLANARVNRLLGITKQVWTFGDGHAPLHMVATTDRALLFHVVDFPFRGAQPPSRIQVIGSETGDTAVVQRLVLAFAHHADQLSARAGQPKINVS
ncbi:MAG: hypothetical protein IT578_12010 [Verrucomicrobiae bacterium]|nr:hypothetical protein [Verrucomicrobiae bacterium]